MSQLDTVESLERLQGELLRLRQHVLDAEQEFAADLQAVPPERRASARNLAHYLGLRHYDIRPLQLELSYLGLSSLGRLEGHVLAGIDSVRYALARMAETPGSEPDRPQPQDFREGDRVLSLRTDELFGPPNTKRQVRIMVTMPSQAATDYALVRDLVAAGMEVMRINSAHDDQQAWASMVEHARCAAKETGRTCQVLLDLSGPKLRTGALEPGTAILRFKPQRDERGVVLQPARVWIGSGPAPSDERTLSAQIPVDAEFAQAIQPGDAVRFKDTRGRRRTLSVLETGPGGAWTECERTAYLEPGLPLRLLRDEESVGRGEVGALPARDAWVHLTAGDTLILTASAEPGRPARKAPDGAVLEPARIPCTLPAVFPDVEVGDPILFDDGKLGGRVTRASAEELSVTIELTRPGGAKLRADKGINLPETHCSLPPLSPEDLRTLDFAAEHVDVIGMSFVRTPADVHLLQDELRRRGKPELGIILKIENRTAFDNLSHLLLAGLRSPPIGVMVARGDLGVELGFERLAEVQEQILWLCEAAHVPVIWATQVLDRLTKTRMPTRAEVTDAAMSGRAECVMLNKGPFIVETVEFLGGVLNRMSEHHHKKTPMLRKLKVSEGRFRDER